jgi:imidazole glycerol-phosphate synthase subunit HisF
MGLAYRIVARLDIKGGRVIKGIRFEGLRVMGDPAEMAKRYADDGADELLYIDTVASLYGRNQLEQLLRKTTESVFVPITVAGGIRSSADARQAFNAGADRVAINTAAISSPHLIRDLADRYGSQAVTVSIEAKRTATGWECYTDCGREKTGKDAIRWAHEAVELGAGELLVTSIDCDGTRGGFDSELLAAIDVDVPVIVSGGMGRVEHLDGLPGDGVAIGAALHYGDVTIPQVKDSLKGRKEIR